MKKTFLIFLTIIFFPIFLHAQDTITVSGNIVNEKGEPVEGVSIYSNYYYNMGGSDKNGYYSIKVPKGTTIYFRSVYNYDYFYEFTVNEPVTTYTQVPVKEKWRNTTTKNQIDGVAIMGEATYEFEHTNNYYANKYIYGIPVGSINISYYLYNSFSFNIDDIYFDKSSGTYKIDIDTKRDKRIKIEYYSSLSFDSPNKLPELQNRFSQGSNGLFVENSKFSYGQQLDSLGVTAINPYGYFKTGIDVKNSINILYRKKETTYSLFYNNNTLTSIVPLSGKSKNTAILNIENIRIKKSKLNIDAHFLDVETDYPESAANYARLMHAISTSPQSFDNNNSDYQSYNEQAVNPYFLINNNYDYKKFRSYRTKIDFTTSQSKPFFLNLKGSFNKVDENFKSGYNANSYLLNSYFSEKNISQNNVFSEISLNYKKKYNISIWYLNFINKLLYRLNYNNIMTDNYYYTFNEYFTNPKIEMNTNELTPTRIIHEATSINDFEFDFNNLEVFINFNPTIYNSSTLKNKQMYFLPSTNFTIFIDHLYRKIIKINANYSENIKEYPLYFASLPFNTLSYNSSNFFQYNEQFYPIISENIEPEKIKSFNTSASLYPNRSWRRINILINYTKTWHSKALFPIFNKSEFIYNNATDYFEESLEFQFSYYRKHYYGFIKKIELNAILEIPRTKVIKLHSTEQQIAFAGFSDVSMNLIEGESVGVIVGSRYLRDENGNRIIGDDGFPIVDSEKGIIADPTPYYIIKLNPNIKFGRFSLDCVFEYSGGGEFWNGTYNALNYYGTSAYSGEFRNFNDTIFEGVTLTGDINTKPVTLTEDVWTQKGFSGVAEDAIQNASNLRLRHISLTYKSKYVFNLFEYELSIWAQNLIFYSLHTGVDTETSLFGYQQIQPLQLFNMPAAKSYGFSLKMRF